MLRHRLVLQLAGQRPDAVHGAVLDPGVALALAVLLHALEEELDDGHEAAFGPLLAQVDDEVAARHALRLEVLHHVVGLAHEFGGVVLPELLVAVVEAHHREQHLAHEGHDVGLQLLPRVGEGDGHHHVVERLHHKALQQERALGLGGEDADKELEKAVGEVVVEEVRDCEFARLVRTAVHLLGAHLGVAVLGEDALDDARGPSAALPEDAHRLVARGRGGHLTLDGAVDERHPRTEERRFLDVERDRLVHARPEGLEHDLLHLRRVLVAHRRGEGGLEELRECWEGRGHDIVELHADLVFLVLEILGHSAQSQNTRENLSRR
mmetsp:Transcript_26423/g.69433  ORF Transcript_26423/g.69433 Transcript_26423/m.69433 type:complete len:323 (+) Transcript_26423:1867-2835(+)